MWLYNPPDAHGIEVHFDDVEFTVHDAQGHLIARFPSRARSQTVGSARKTAQRWWRKNAARIGGVTGGPRKSPNPGG